MRFHHVGIEVQNLEKAIAFYKNELGFEIESRLSLMGEEIAFLTLAGFRFELVEGEGTPGKIHICYEVGSLTEMMRKSPSNDMVDGPYSLHNGWKSVFYEGKNNEIIEYLQTR